MNDTTQTLTDPLYLAVDYGRSLEAMIAAGRYDWANSHITAEEFPTQRPGTVQVEAKLFRFDCYISSEDAGETIKTAATTHPWEPANIEHLLSFGATYPDEQRRYPIVALGSVAEVGGDRLVPYLSGHSAGRSLNLFWWFDDWDDGCCVLAVRNRSSGA